MLLAEGLRFEPDRRRELRRGAACSERPLFRAEVAFGLPLQAELDPLAAAGDLGVVCLTPEASV